jgi:hypothetical protein
MFVLSLGYSAMAAVLLSFHRNLFTDLYDSKSRKVHFGLWVVVAGQQLLILAAFAVSALAVMAYVEDVGIAGEVLTVLFAIIISGLWLLQSMQVPINSAGSHVARLRTTLFSSTLRQSQVHLLPVHMSNFVFFSSFMLHFFSIVFTFLVHWIIVGA